MPFGIVSQVLMDDGRATGPVAIFNQEPARGPRGGRKKEDTVDKVTALLLGIAAWAGVAVVAVLITFNIGDKNQILMFLPILAAVVAAWAIGEFVTQRMFVESGEEG